MASGLPAGFVVLAGFWLLLVGSTWNKSITYDELVHAPAGYAYWKYNDFRLNPENGNLPQRFAALAFLGDRTPLPPTTHPAWQLPEEWEFGEAWFHLMGHDVPGILHRGRALAALQAVALAALIWAWSRKLFGPAGGLLSLTLCVLNPTILANGALITSDTAAALFFLAATWAIWAVLEKTTPLRLIGCALAVGGLFVSKSSALLIIPIAGILMAARLVNEFAEWRKHLRKFAILSTVIGASVFGIIWGFYGFRYEAFAPGLPSANGSAPLWQGTVGERSLPEMVEELGLPQPARDQARQVLNARNAPIYGWSSLSDAALGELKSGVLSPTQVIQLDGIIAAAKLPAVVRGIQFLARNKVLPEAYLLGFAHAYRFAQMRNAFFNGEFLRVGSPWFFPYSFMVKTPLPLLGIIGLALGTFFFRSGERERADAGSARSRSPLLTAFYQTLPLWTLFGLYWLAAVNSGLNIGHRHILSVYPPLFVLCGAVGNFVVQWAVGQWGSRAVLALVGLHAAETALRFPNYISYFNGIVSPSNGYRHFIDSTVDWGQDLPGVRDYIEDHKEAGTFYLSYFGNDDPRAYGIKARLLPSNPGRFLRTQQAILFIPVVADPSKAQVEQFRQDHPDHDFIGMGIDGNTRIAVMIRKRTAWPLTAGTYLISATNLQVGWADSDEAIYQQLRQAAKPFTEPSAATQAALRERGFRDWRELLNAYDNVRQGRLAAFLRAYDPDDEIGNSILVFKLTDADITRALDGPKPGRAYLDKRLSD